MKGGTGSDPAHCLIGYQTLRVMGVRTLEPDQ